MRARDLVSNPVYVVYSIYAYGNIPVIQFRIPDCQ